MADGKPVSPCALRGIKIATIMQNPRSAFNPLHTMHTHARETCLALGKPADDATLTAAIEAVGLENAARVRYRCLKPPVSRDGAENRKYRPFVVW